MTQTSFEFDGVQHELAALSTNPPARPRKPRAAKASATPATAPAPPPALEPEAMALLLEQHPDFRVLRRLVPITDFGPPPPTLDPGAVQRVLVLDTETTGLSHQSDKIIELAMLLVSVDSHTGQPFGPVEILEGFEDPGMPIPAVAQEVTGISDEMVKGQRLDDERVQAMVERADLIVAHNAGFDRPFVEARFPGFASRRWACSFMDIDWKAAGAGSAKLGALAQDQGWFYDAHRARVDCHALLQVLTCPVKPGEESGLHHLLEAASQLSYKLRATGSPFESKDKLKARGYRWDGDAKTWYASLPDPGRLQAEKDWLRQEVYGRRPARVEVEALDSRVRHSLRPGPMETLEV